MHVLPNLPVPFFLQRGLFCLTLLFAASAGTPGQSPAADSPATTLRDALVAACSQNTADFVKALTVRNAEAFSRLTPPARQTFLKRFVLLDKPGKPRSQNDSSGDLVVYCETSELTTQMEIAKPELRDNLAYLPLTVKDSGDSAGLNVHQVTMGMVREGGQWKMLSLGLLFLDLPSLEIEWDRAEMKANEQTAVASLKTLVDAIETYRKTYTRLPESLKALGPAPAAQNAQLPRHELYYSLVNLLGARGGPSSIETTVDWPLWTRRWGELCSRKSLRRRRSANSSDASSLASSDNKQQKRTKVIFFIIYTYRKYLKF